MNYFFDNSNVIFLRNRLIVEFKLILILVLIHGVRKVKNRFHPFQNLLINQCMSKLDQKSILTQQCVKDELRNEWISIKDDFIYDHVLYLIEKTITSSHIHICSFSSRFLATNQRINSPIQCSYRTNFI
jgi:Rps23 Pro-64 3,4-dihydroxylase Tpa1-like proline 4-hydroxylase